MGPKARQEKLLVEEVGDELVVYDQERRRAHRLNRTAALTWRHCDGRKSVAELAAVLQEELGPAADEGLVQVALDRLEAADLLQDAARRSADEARVSRRGVVRRLGLVGAATFLLPIVVTLATPGRAKAQASSGGGPGCIGCICISCGPCV